MASAYSQDLRDRVLAAYDRGMVTKRIAETFGVSGAWARRIKQLLRTLARRTRDTLWRAMQGVLDAVTPSDAINCFRHCGYTLHGQ